jgi:hypothetical protein
MDEVHKLSNSGWYKPSSEPSRVYWIVILKSKHVQCSKFALHTLIQKVSHENKKIFKEWMWSRKERLRSARERRKLNSVAWVSDRTIPTERPQLVHEVSANFAYRGSHVVSVTDPCGSNLDFLDQSHYFFFQPAPQLYSRGWVDPVPDPLLLRKPGNAGNRTRTFWICSMKLWPLDHRGGLLSSI